MLSRITLLLITVFWLCMNFLLWRSEFGSHNHAGAKVPVSLVWQKILTAPDPSRGLQILHHGKEIGRCDWDPVVGQEISPEKILSDGAPPAGSAQKMTGYRVEFNGSFSLADAPNRLRFKVIALFGPDLNWREFETRLMLRPDTWVVHSKAAEKTLRVRMEGEDETSDRIYKFSDLENPRFLIQEFQLPISLQLFDALGVPTSGQSAASLAPGLVWEARNDWVTIGHTAVRAFRLQAHIFDRFMIVIVVNEVGEILRVELPDEWSIINDQFSDL